MLLGAACTPGLHLAVAEGTRVPQLPQVCWRLPNSLRVRRSRLLLLLLLLLLPLPLPLPLLQRGIRALGGHVRP